MENGRKNNAIFWELSQIISMSKNRNDMMILFVGPGLRKRSFEGRRYLQSLDST